MNCKGTCYLAKELAKESEKTDNNPFGENRSKVELQQIVYFKPFAQMDFQIDFQRTNINNFMTSHVLISTLFVSDISYPPVLA